MQPQHIKAFLENLREDGIKDNGKYIPIIDLGVLLKKRKVTRSELSVEAGISVNTAGVACQGTNVVKNTAEKICKALGLNFKETYKPVCTDGKLSDKTVLHYFRLISSILNGAVMDDQVILSNPAKRVRPPQCKQKEAPYLDEVQAAQMIELLESEPFQFKTMIFLLLYSGMRRGELCGLEWKDIDFTNKLVSIRRESQYIPKKGIITKSTKNGSSVRTIKLSETAME